MKTKLSQFTVYIEQDEDGMYIGSIPSIPSCYTEGRTLEEMLSNLEDVVKLCLRNTNTKELSRNRFVGIQNLVLSNA